MFPCDTSKRHPEMVSAGCHLDGVVCPRPDTSDPQSGLKGAEKRIRTKMPPCDVQKYTELKLHCKALARLHLLPIDSTYDMSVEAWLAKTNYPEWRRSELMKVYTESDFFQKLNDRRYFEKHAVVGGFLKQEFYPEFKQARGIHARKDLFKCLFGPFFKAIEERVFKLPQFVKYVPVRERARYLNDRLGSVGAVYAQTDYSSCEANFSRRLMRAVERPMYEMLLEKHPMKDVFMKAYDYVICCSKRPNTIAYKFFKVFVEARRMSGEMNTSLGNGWANYVIMDFVAKTVGSQVTGVFEGDDGLCVFHPIAPSVSDFTKLGLTVKLEYYDQLSRASFCGLVFDDHDLIVVADPKKSLATFSWIQKQYLRSRPGKLQALLRCKALSLLSQYPGCPILQALGSYGLRVTKNTTKLTAVIDTLRDMWERDKIMAAIKDGHEDKEVPIRTRILVEEVFGVSVSQQLLTEEKLSLTENLEVLSVPIDFPEMWSSFADVYVAPFDRLKTYHMIPPIIACTQCAWTRLVNKYAVPHLPLKN